MTVSVLRLKILDGCDEPYVEFYVDGENFGSRVKSALGEAGFDDVLPWYGGDYKIEDTVIGRPARNSGAEGAVFLACGCGQVTCSGVLADVAVSANTVTLCNFRSWLRDKTVLAPVEPVVFDRDQFEAAALQLERDIALWQPQVKSTDAAGGG